jgi:NTE family protein
MNPKAQDSLRTAIVLQGGGEMGAYEFDVLKALYETRSRGRVEPFKPAVVAGISIGAITAAVLVGSKSDPIENLEKLWAEDFTVSGPLPEVSAPFFQR